MNCYSFPDTIRKMRHSRILIQESNAEVMSKPRICSFESRRASEMQVMLQKLGAEPFVAPSMQEVPLNDHSEAIEFAEQLISGEIDVLIFLTGVGVITLVDAMETKFDRQQLLGEIAKRTIVVRGPKPVAVLKKWQMKHHYKAEAPNTWHEIIGLFDEHVDELQNKVVAIQEYGERNEELATALKKRGCTVQSIAIYRWAMPDDTGPLQAAIEKTIAGEFDILMFTSAQQVHNLLNQAGSMNLLDEFRDAASRIEISSIGPTCTETLNELNFEVDYEPEHNKMGQLVKSTIDAYLAKQD